MDANRVTLTDRSWISFNVSTQDQQEYNHCEGVARSHMNVVVEMIRLYPLGGNPHVVMKLHRVAADICEDRNWPNDEGSTIWSQSNRLSLVLRCGPEDRGGAGPTPKTQQEQTSFSCRPSSSLTTLVK